MSAALRRAAHTRLTGLRHDLLTGRAEITRLTETMLRIEGAVQIIEELLATPEPAAAPCAGAAPEEPVCPNPNEDARMNFRSAW